MTETAVLDTRIAKALAHPLRFKLLTLINEGVATPRELSRRLDEPLGNVSYHVRFLAGLGCIDLVRTRKVRGAVEHHYRATVRPVLSDNEWASVPASARGSIVGDVLERAFQDVAAAAKKKSFDRPETHVSRTNLALDDEGFADLTALLAETLERAMEIQSQSAGRMVALEPDEREPVDTKLIMMGFAH